jgi:hypothetical protein
MMRMKETDGEVVFENGQVDDVAKIELRPHIDLQPTIVKRANKKVCFLG